MIKYNAPAFTLPNVVPLKIIDWPTPNPVVSFAVKILVLLSVAVIVRVALGESVIAT